MPAQTTRVFTVETPVRDFPLTFCFNQFAVERTDMGSLLSVGYLWNGRLLDDALTFSISSEALEISHHTTMEYLGRTGEIAPMEFLPVRPALRVLPANIVSMSHRASVAETMLHNFAFRLTLAETKDTSFQAEPVALLISPLNVQRHLIRVLYHQ